MTAILVLPAAAELRLNAGATPDVVVSERSVPTPSPNVVVPVVFTMFTPPLPDPVTVMSSNSLPAPMFVVVTSRPMAPVLVIEMIPLEAKLAVPAALRSIPVAPFVDTVRFERLQVPLVLSSSTPGWVPAVPVSTTFTSSMVPPASPAPPAIPPPVPCGSIARPRTSLPSASEITSPLLSVSCGRLAASALWRLSEPTVSVAASPTSFWLDLRSIPAL
jgi:hypothetical protein